MGRMHSHGGARWCTHVMLVWVGGAICMCTGQSTCILPLAMLRQTLPPELSPHQAYHPGWMDAHQSSEPSSPSTTQSHLCEYLWKGGMGMRITAQRCSMACATARRRLQESPPVLGKAAVYVIGKAAVYVTVEQKDWELGIIVHNCAQQARAAVRASRSGARPPPTPRPTPTDKHFLSP